MAKRDNHYEAAFEGFLRDRLIPYVAVDETKRAKLGDASLKSLDFIVSTPLGISWLVDVKGRKFPSGVQKHYWRNWSTADDIRSLTAWQHLFGGKSQGLFVFAYELVADRAPLPVEQLYEYQDRLYGFVGISLSDYAAAARPLSSAWQTVTMPAAEFRRKARGVQEFFSQVAPPEWIEEPSLV